MKNILVACGGAVVTAQVAADAVRILCQKHGIDAQVHQCRINQLPDHVEGADLIVATTRVDADYGVPVVPGIAFISGVDREGAEQAILEALQS